MATISIQRTTDLPAREVYEKVRIILSEDKSLRKLDPTYTVDFDATALTGSVRGKLFAAGLKVASSTNTRVALEVNLAKQVMVFKGLVEKSLEQRLDALLAQVPVT